MANSPRDLNRVPVVLFALNTDGITTVPLAVNPTNHGIKVSDGTTGTDHGGLPAARDENRIPVMVGASSADGVTLVEIYADSSGALQINSK